MKSKFLSEEEYHQFLSEQRHYYETVPLKNIALDLLSKYGFNDGDDIPSELNDVIKKRAEDLAEALDGVCGFKSCVVGTPVHNPYFVAFEMGEDYYHYYDLPREVKWKIDKILESLDEYQNTEK
ncbi:hypothetical protein FJZ31_08165 [Candidatus Poribacteria bacterium]|nr:hypothetical protein [Candidatus Poribacteria bacterium]